MSTCLVADRSNAMTLCGRPATRPAEILCMNWHSRRGVICDHHHQQVTAPHPPRAACPQCWHATGDLVICDLFLHPIGDPA